MMEPTRLIIHDFVLSLPSFHMAIHELKEIVPMHWHDFYELSYVISGSGTQNLNGTVQPLAKGVFMLLTPADFHEVMPDEGNILRKFNVIFKEDMLEPELASLLFQDLSHKMVVLDEADFTAIEADFNRLWMEYSSNQEGRRVGVRSTLNRLLLDLFRKSEVKMTKDGSQDITNETIRRALIFIQHHFREKLTLQEAAARVNLSPNYFSEQFRKETGITFQGYLLALRLEYARSLLSASTLSITEICFTSGFHTLSHFERAFKRKFGQTPRGGKMKLAH
jgi:AraC-like DNA-binding protein